MTRPCSLGCQPDWHKDGCDVYLPDDPNAMPDYPAPELDEYEPDSQDLAALQADRETLRDVTTQLVQARIALDRVARAVAPAVKRADGQSRHWRQRWVNLDLGAAREAVRVSQELGARP